MTLERHLQLQLPLDGSGGPLGAALLGSYLSCPQRVLMDLLKNRRLKQVSPGTFRHVPRPIELAGFRLEPTVRLQAHWQEPSLRIQLLDFRLPALESLERRVHYGFQAEMIALDDGLDLSASVSLDLGEGGLGLLPAPLLRLAGDRLLGLILERLRQRCLRHLPPAIAGWAAAPRSETSAELPAAPPV